MSFSRPNDVNLRFRIDRTSGVVFWKPGVHQTLVFFNSDAISQLPVVGHSEQFANPDAGTLAGKPVRLIQSEPGLVYGRSETASAAPTVRKLVCWHGHCIDNSRTPASDRFEF